jgi:hypothetical protein
MLVPMDVVTVTSTVVVCVEEDTVSAGAVAVSEESLVTLKVVAGLDPKSTPVAPVKPVPVTTTDVPPVLGPDRGLTPVTTGVAAAPATLVGWLPTTGRTTKMTVATAEAHATDQQAVRVATRLLGVAPPRVRDRCPSPRCMAITPRIMRALNAEVVDACRRGTPRLGRFPHHVDRCPRGVEHEVHNAPRPSPQPSPRRSNRSERKACRLATPE